MWRKASKCSAANCLEADGPWLKAAASNPSGNCLEAQWQSACSAHGSCLEAQYISASACESNACLEAAYISASACLEAACVEAAEVSGVVRVRDSKQWKDGNEGPILVYLAATWDNGRVIDFIPAVGTDQYMVLGVTETGDDAALFFTQGEVDAFLQGIEDDDFVLAGEVA
jgi:hypothetical protein